MSRSDHFSIPYIDDVICHAPTFSEHLRRLRSLFQCLREANLKLKGDKVFLARTKVNYLSFEISGDGIRLSKSKVVKILHIPQPKTLKEAKGFCGALLYYKAHLPDLSRILNPIYALSKKNTKFNWSTDKR